MTKLLMPVCAAIFIFCGSGFAAHSGKSADKLTGSVVKGLAEPTVDSIGRAADSLASPTVSPLPADLAWRPPVSLPASGAVGAMTRKIMDLFLKPAADNAGDNISAAAASLADPNGVTPNIKTLSAPPLSPAAQTVSDRIAEAFINPLIRKFLNDTQTAVNTIPTTDANPVDTGGYGDIEAAASRISSELTDQQNQALQEMTKSERAKKGKKAKVSRKSGGEFPDVIAPSEIAATEIAPAEVSGIEVAPARLESTMPASMLDEHKSLIDSGSDVR